MSRHTIVVAGSLLALLAAGSVLHQEGPRTIGAVNEQPDTTGADVSATKLPEVTPAKATQEAHILSDDQVELLEDPRVIRFNQDLEFQSRIRAFFEQAGSLNDEARAQQAAAIEDQLESRRADGKVSGPEALQLRLALVRILALDPQQREAASRAVLREFQLEAEQRMSQWQNRSQPKFTEYKQREQAIVQEVMAMETIPGSMERNQYLRLRLQRAREDAMGER